jgi:hypothetical protein
MSWCPAFSELGTVEQEFLVRWALGPFLLRFFSFVEDQVISTIHPSEDLSSFSSPL